jgi:rhodanese-related sulfurtransferase
MLSRAPQLDDRGLPQGYRFNPDIEVTPRQVKAMRDAGEDCVLIDCRTPGEFELVRIEGATLVPLQEAAARVEELRPLAARKLIVHCHHGARSLQMTHFLRRAGFADVYSMAGGIDLWALDIDPGMARY